MGHVAMRYGQSKGLHYAYNVVRYHPPDVKTLFHEYQNTFARYDAKTFQLQHFQSDHAYLGQVSESVQLLPETHGKWLLSRTVADHTTQFPFFTRRRAFVPWFPFGLAELHLALLNLDFTSGDSHSIPIIPMLNDLYELGHDAFGLTLHWEGSADRTVNVNGILNFDNGVARHQELFNVTYDRTLKLIDMLDFSDQKDHLQREDNFSTGSDADVSWQIVKNPPKGVQDTPPYVLTDVGRHLLLRSGQWDKDQPIFLLLDAFRMGMIWLARETSARRAVWMEACQKNDGAFVALSPIMGVSSTLLRRQASPFLEIVRVYRELLASVLASHMHQVVLVADNENSYLAAQLLSDLAEHHMRPRALHLIEPCTQPIAELLLRIKLPPEYFLSRIWPLPKNTPLDQLSGNHGVPVHVHTHPDVAVNYPDHFNIVPYRSDIHLNIFSTIEDGGKSATQWAASADYLSAYKEIITRIISASIAVESET